MCIVLSTRVVLSFGENNPLWGTVPYWAGHVAAKPLPSNDPIPSHCDKQFLGIKIAHNWGPMEGKFYMFSLWESLDYCERVKPRNTQKE